MKFAPLELCKKLVELGCKSSLFPDGRKAYYIGAYSKQGEAILGETLFLAFPEEIENNHWKGLPLQEAFSQNDFTGCHEQARENARLVWGGGIEDVIKEDCPACETSYHKQDVMLNPWFYYRYEMIDSDDWVKFLQGSLE